MELNQPANQKTIKKSQLLILYYFSFSMVATTRAENTHIGNNPAGRPKTTKMSQYLILCYLSFSMVAFTRAENTHTMALNQP